jgi:hypothetical protein
MARRHDIARLFVVALMAVTLVGVLTPVCEMPECDTFTVGVCNEGDLPGDFKSACDDCGESIVMKHSHDDATRAQGVVLPDLAVAALAPDSAVRPVVTAQAMAPEATASPPPLDPLGVRLLV